MANRRLSRSIVLQTLFEWDWHTKKPEVAMSALGRNIAEFGAEGGDDPFMKSRKLMQNHQSAVRAMEGMQHIQRQMSKKFEPQYNP